MRFRKSKKQQEDEKVIGSVIEGMKRLYKEKLRPLEEAYQFQDFYSELLTDADFDAKPQILLVGQYSVGKTSFIRYLLESDFPGQHIGPEPTTDRFMAIFHADSKSTIPGNAIVIQPDRPYQGLTKFGGGFLNKFQASCLPAPLLEHITFVDTPGVLAGEKQRLGRAYDFVEVCKWFAERCDLILMLFDANKLDISDEFKRTIEGLRGHDDKIRIVLNKADSVSPNQLLRVYGALMWSLGKVITTPEVIRVYVGSFWDQPLVHEEQKKVFAQEEADLMADLLSLPRNAIMRKVNELVKRARLARHHAYIITHLSSQMPRMGKASGQVKLMKNLEAEIEKVAQTYGLVESDLPDLEIYRSRLGGAMAEKHELSNFPVKPDMKLIEAAEAALTADIPALMKQFPDEASGVSAGEASALSIPDLDEVNPFAKGNVWDIDDADKEKYDKLFEACEPDEEGKITGDAGREMLMKSRLPMPVLGKIWALADVDKDGKLDDQEFAVAMHLVHQKLNGYAVPEKLPPLLCPPSKRHLLAKGKKSEE